MGIKNLSKFIKAIVPEAYKENKITSYHGRIIAIDISMCLYQFMVAIRVNGENLKNKEGQITSHLTGLFFRTIRLIENGIKPIYVFDGAPPSNKLGTLEKRNELLQQNQKALEEAIEKDNFDDINKFSKRTVRVTKEHNEEAKQLLELMGIPFVTAASEAEAQCAQMVKLGQAYAVATEDMDALTFGSNILLRNLLSSSSKNLPIIEFNLDVLLRNLAIDHKTFIDLCILMGCDYCSSIKGIGPHKALNLLKKYGSIENILNEKSQYTIEGDPDIDSIRKLFSEPTVSNLSCEKFEWKHPNKDSLTEYLVTKKGFNANTVENGIERLNKALKRTTQSRMDQFFKVNKLAPSSKQDNNVKKKAGKTKSK